MNDDKTNERYDNFRFRVSAVIFGTDETLLNVKLKDGFSFVKRSLVPMKDSLCQEYTRDAWEMRREYDAAKINTDLDVICVEKTIEKEMSTIAVKRFFHREMDKALASLDNQIKVIRLEKECMLYCINIWFTLQAARFCHLYDRITIIPIVGTPKAKIFPSFHLDESDIQSFNDRVVQLTFPITNATLNMAHSLYDLSYFQTNSIALLILIIALEAIYLDDNGPKATPLAKRCAMFLEKENNKAYIDRREQLKTAYCLRNQLVHGQKFPTVSNEMILFLRECCRKTLLSLDTSFDKAQFINSIKEKVQECDPLDCQA